MTKFCLKFRIQAGYIALNFLFSHVKAWGGPHVMRLSTLVSPLKPSRWGRERLAHLCFIVSDNPHRPTCLKSQSSGKITLSLALLTVPPWAVRDCEASGKPGRSVCPQRRGCSFPRSQARAPPPRPWGFLGEPFQPHPGSEGNARQTALQGGGRGGSDPGVLPSWSSGGTRAAGPREGREPLLASSVKKTEHLSYKHLSGRRAEYPK